MGEMTFPYAPARGRAAECKPSPRKGAAALPAELPAQPPQPPKYRQFFKLVICSKPQVCKAPEIAAKAARSCRRDPAEPPAAGAATDAESIATAAEAAAQSRQPCRQSKRETRHRSQHQPYILYLSQAAPRRDTDRGEICRAAAATKQAAHSPEASKGGDHSEPRRGQ